MEFCGWYLIFRQTPFNDVAMRNHGFYDTYIHIYIYIFTKIISGSRSVSVRSCRIENSKIPKRSQKFILWFMMILFRQNWCAPPLAPTHLTKQKRIPTGQPVTRWCEPTQKQHAHVFHKHHHTLQLQAGLNSFEQFWSISFILSKINRFLVKIEQVLSRLFSLEKGAGSKLYQI